MATFSQNEHQLLLVGKNIAKASTTTIAGLADGEIGIFTPGGTKLTQAAAAAGAKFNIYLGRGANLTPLKSPVFDATVVSKVTKQLTSPATVKLQYIGYNGVSGSINVNNNTVYRASINILERPETNHGGVYVKDLAYKSDASAIQAEIAVGLTKNAIGAFSREAEQAITFKAINDVALAAADDFDNAVSIVKGSDTISVATNLVYTGTTPAVVGDYVRLASTSAGTVALTSDVYKIINISGLYITLDRPVQVATGTYTNASTNQVIPAATGNVANWGMALTGGALKFTVGKILNKVSEWQLSLDSDSFGTTVITDSASAFVGTNTNNQIAELEWFTSGNNGEWFRMGEPNIYPFNSMLTAGEDYDIIEIQMDRGRTDSLGKAPAQQTLTLAIPTTTAKVAGHYALAATADDVTDVLEILLAGKPVFGGSITTNGGALATGDLAIV